MPGAASATAASPPDPQRHGETIRLTQPFGPSPEEAATRLWPAPSAGRSLEAVGIDDPPSPPEVHPPEHVIIRRRYVVTHPEHDEHHEYYHHPHTYYHTLGGGGD